jgi:putative transposase
LQEAPAVAVGDGALGFWAVLEKVFPHHPPPALLGPQACPEASRRERQRAQLPALVGTAQGQGGAAPDLDGIHPSHGRGAFEQFIQVYEAKYPKAVQCLVKDRERLLTFYDFPAEHWVHLRTTNPVESTLGTIRHRADRAKGCVTRDSMLTFAYKLTMCAQ